MKAIPNNVRYSKRITSSTRQSSQTIFDNETFEPTHWKLIDSTHLWVQNYRESKTQQILQSNQAFFPLVIRPSGD